MTNLTTRLRRAALALTCALILPTVAAASSLPQRDRPPPATTKGVPHIQIGVEAKPEISSELLRRVSLISGVEIRPTVVSLPGAKGFWLNEEVDVARPEVIVGGREFAHVHPDGSLHASLSPDLAKLAVATGWAVHHPWANQRPGWEGFVMIYTPGSEEELETVFGLVLDSYRYVTGGEPLLSED